MRERRDGSLDEVGPGRLHSGVVGPEARTLRGSWALNREEEYLAGRHREVHGYGLRLRVLRLSLRIGGQRSWVPRCLFAGCCARRRPWRGNV